MPRLERIACTIIDAGLVLVAVAVVVCCVMALSEALAR